MVQRIDGGWRRVIRIRQSGKTAGQIDLYLMSPVGTKLRSTHDLAKFVQEYDYFERIDPYEVNFEKPPYKEPLSANSRAFIKWVESKGKTKPSFMKRSSKKSLKTATTRYKAVKCDNCQLRLEDIGANLCNDCILGADEPLRVLQSYMDRFGVLPLPEDHNRLRKQTKLSAKEIDEWFTEQFESLDLIPDFDVLEEEPTATESVQD